MSRVLLTWELGLNLGHLARLLPIAESLKREGHTILMAVRDIRTAAPILGPRGIPFVQAPHLPSGIPLGHRATGFADILLSQGWSDGDVLWGLTSAWLNAIRMFRPDSMILDYSPSALVAARIAGVPCTSIGNGFELPPLTNPLPCFPGFSWADPQRALESEQFCVRNLNRSLVAYGAASVASLREALGYGRRFAATYRDLDHYGPREDVEYIGLLAGEINGPAVKWPKSDGPKIFVLLRKDTAYLDEAVAALCALAANAICVGFDLPVNSLERLRKAGVVVYSRPVNLSGILDADLCVSYGAEGTMLRYLVAGTPQLILPWHVETVMAARRIESCGLGSAIWDKQSVDSIRAALQHMTSDASYRARALAFSENIASESEAIASTEPARVVTHWGQKLELRMLLASACERH